MELYRYIPFERFKEIVEKKSLYFVNPFTMWEDDKEGFLYRLAQESEQLVKIDKALGMNNTKKAIVKQLRNGGLYKDEKTDRILDWFGMRCQSWSKSGNEYGMWTAYSYDKHAVCIAVDTSKLLSLYCDGHKVEGFNVEYVEELSIENELKKAIVRNNEFYFPFVLKSKLHQEFAFENEYGR